MTAGETGELWYSFCMDEILKENQKYQKTADNFLASSNLVSILKKYGEIHFAGSYPAGLMMHGDIDMRVVKEDGFSVEEVFDVFRDVYFSTNFRSYFISGDWDDPRKGNEFPNGRYVGIKMDIDDERWKLDVWFVSKSELERLDIQRPTIANITLSQEQRNTILQFKKIRKEEGLKITGQEIYNLILVENVRDFNVLRSRAKQDFL